MTTKTSSANRLVILFSPVFVGLAGWAADLATRYLPGHPELDSSELTIVFVAGGTWAATQLLLWLRGWQKHEERQAAPIQTEIIAVPEPPAALASSSADVPGPQVMQEPPLVMPQVAQEPPPVAAPQVMQEPPPVIPQVGQEPPPVAAPQVAQEPPPVIPQVGQEPPPVAAPQVAQEPPPVTPPQ